ncbi:hypothetical protein BDQ17DRAFT_1536238 [Cyathus striatus]|nr:hypothetical protein BDQ17DRAFT_1536238 [Cyathus striatus]
MTPHVSGNECSVISVSESSSSEEKNEVQTSKHADLTEGSPCTPQERQENREGVAMPSASPTISAESPTQGAGQATPPPYTYGATGGVNYYPTPWIQPYPHHVPYYGAYPAYASQAQYSDIPSGSPGIPPWVQGGAYTAYIPYSPTSPGHRALTSLNLTNMDTVNPLLLMHLIGTCLRTGMEFQVRSKLGSLQAPVWNHHPQTPSASLSPSTSSQGPPIPVGGRHVVSGNSAPWAHIPSHLYYPAPSFPYSPPLPLIRTLTPVYILLLFVAKLLVGTVLTAAVVMEGPALLAVGSSAPTRDPTSVALLEYLALTDRLVPQLLGWSHVVTSYPFSCAWHSYQHDAPLCHLLSYTYIP